MGELEVEAAGGADGVVAVVVGEGVGEGGLEGGTGCFADGEGGGGEEAGDVSGYGFVGEFVLGCVGCAML